MPTPPSPLVPEPMKRSWLEQNPRWKIAVGFLTLLFLLIAFGGLVMIGVTASFRGSEVYQQALAAAAENHLVRREIGDPIQPSWFVTGQLNVSGSTGNADLSIPVSGSKGRGVIRAVAFKAEGIWRFTYLQVNVAGQGATINLLMVAPTEPQPDRD